MRGAGDRDGGLGGRAAPTARAGQQAAGPLTGQSMWIWELARTEGGDLARIVTSARQYGLGAVYLKSGDGATAWPQFSPATVATLHAAGLRVCAWQFVYGRRPGRRGERRRRRRGARAPTA